MDTTWVVRSTSDRGDAGWEMGLPPGITKEQWPRSRRSGLPLIHGFTVRVPDAFRARGPGYMAISYFHPGDSESYYPDAGVADRVRAIRDGEPLRDDEAGHPFWQAVQANARSEHPATVYHTDVLEHDHVIVWHTEEAFTGPRCERPETPLPPLVDGRAMHLEHPVEKERALSFASEKPDRVMMQFGWPLHPVQASDDELRDMGFGDMVLEIETDVGGANYGDGNCQIDLESAVLDWACT